MYLSCLIHQIVYYCCFFLCFPLFQDFSKYSNQDTYKLALTQVVYAHLDEALNLADAGEDISQIEASLNRFLQENTNCSFQRTDLESQPFIINMKVRESGWMHTKAAIKRVLKRHKKVS